MEQPGPSRPRGLVFLDVDGPLYPYRNKPERRPDGYRTWKLTRGGRWVTGPEARKTRGRLAWLNPDHGAWLTGLADATGFDLVWATAHLDDANRFVGPAVGLGELETLRFGDAITTTPGDAQWRPDGPWKYDAVAARAAGLPLVWFDDEHDHRVAVDEIGRADPRRDRILAARGAALARFHTARAGLPTLLCQVPPETGLTADHLRQARLFADGLHEPAPGRD